MGSLLRPPRLLEARERHAAGDLGAAGLREVEDDAIRDAVQMQHEAGLQAATDGEFRRTAWHMDFIYQLGGIHRSDGQIEVHFENADAFRFLAGLTEGTDATAKLTIPSPSMVHYRGGSAAIDPEGYPDETRFWADLTTAYAEQLRAMHELGCRYFQLDDVSLAYLNDPAQREMIEQRGGDAEHQHEHYIRQVNAALADRPDDLAVTTHLIVDHLDRTGRSQTSERFRTLAQAASQDLVHHAERTEIGILTFAHRRFRQRDRFALGTCTPRPRPRWSSGSVTRAGGTARQLHPPPVRCWRRSCDSSKRSSTRPVAAHARWPERGCRVR